MSISVHSWFSNESLRLSKRVELNLEKAIGTAKYANHAKTKRIGEKDGFTQRENALFDSTPFLSCIWRVSRFELAEKWGQENLSGYQQPKLKNPKCLVSFGFPVSMVEMKS